MAENIRIDSHKLIYHPQAVAKWMDGDPIYPIEVEISPSGTCNHRCVFCAVDYLGYKPVFLDKETVLRDVKQMHSKGLKSVICSGEGEPLLNADMPEIANGIKECGVVVAMSTNGAIFTIDKLEECLHSFTWVRYSIASMEEKSYNEIQRGKEGDLKRVRQNLRDAVKVKKKNNLKTTLGIQCLLLQQNKHQIVEMAQELRDIGVDYFTIKPYSQHKHSNNSFAIDYNELLDLEKEVKEYETETFSIYFRANAMKKMHHDKCYDRCYGMPFMTHIDAAGNVWPCVAHIGNKEFVFGNINNNTFEEIWEGSRRKEVINKINSLDINKVCREACRLDEINKYLNELKHPGEHVNFI